MYKNGHCCELVEVYVIWLLYPHHANDNGFSLWGVLFGFISTTIFFSYKQTKIDTELNVLLEAQNVYFNI